MLFSLATLLPLMVCVFWSALLLLSCERPLRLSRRWLLAWTLTASVLYFCHAVFFHHAAGSWTIFDAVYVVANLAVYPLFYCYLSVLTTGRVSRVAWGAATVFPLAMGAVYGFLIAYPSSLIPPGGDTLRRWFEMFWHGAFAVEVVVVVALGRQKIGHYNRLVDECYADTDGRSCRQAGDLLVAMSAVALLSVVANAIGRSSFHTGGTGHGLLPLTFMSVGFSALLFAVCYVAWRQRFEWCDLQGEWEAPVSHSASEATPSAPDEAAMVSSSLHGLAQSIVSLMEEEQLYLSADLKIGDLARRLYTNRRYVQQAINEELHLSFADFVNSRRIDHAAKLIASHPELPLRSVAEQSGYASVSSFYRNYRKYKGQTPRSMKNDNAF